MNILIIWCTFVVVSSFPHNSDIQQKIGVIYRGPGSSVIIEGPDGSVIKADAIGGSISVKDLILTENSGSAVSSVLTREKDSTENVSSTDSSTVTEEITQETRETPSESTTSNEESSTDATDTSSNVTILEPTTLPPVPSEGKDEKSENSSDTVSEDGFTIVVAEPTTALFKDLDLQTAPEPIRKKDVTTQPQLVLERIPNTPAIQYFQPAGADWFTPQIYANPISNLEWSIPLHSIFH